MPDRTHEDGALPTYRTKLTALFAADAPVAVILRRGPRKHFRLILWQLTDDTFEPGQWLIGGDVRLWDLSPDGGKLIYHAAQWRRAAAKSTPNYDPLSASIAPKSVHKKRPHRKIPRYLGGGDDAPRHNTGTWTAVSTPPYFTALALWPSNPPIGGGAFRGPHEIRLNEADGGLIPVVNVPPPTSLRISGWSYAEDEAWRGSARRPAESAHDARDGALWKAIAATGIRYLDWVTTGCGPDLLFAAEGKIYRLPDWSGLAAADIVACARPIADFTSMVFEPIAPPPEAMHWW